MSAFLKGIDLLPMGYSPVWVDPVDGLPHMPKWDRLRTEQMHPESIRWWSSLRPQIGLAVVGGFNDVVPIDVDTSDPEIKAAFLSAMPRPNVARFGTKGFGAFYRGKVKGKNFMTKVGGDTRPLVEVKSNGVLTIPPTNHRKTGKPYRWMSTEPGVCRTLFNTHVSELVEITQDHIDALERALAPWCLKAPVYEVMLPQGPIGPVSDKRMHAVALGAVRKACACLAALQTDRNITLRSKARSLGKYVHKGVLTQEYVETELLEACKVNGSYEKHGRKQCHWTIASGFKAAINDDLPVLQDRPYANHSASETRISA
jgi:hypothetical protein